MKASCTLDYLLVSKQLSKLTRECKILPNIYSDHSAADVSVMFEQTAWPCLPGFWKLNNFLLSDTNYIELLTFKIPEFFNKHQHVEDKAVVGND